MTFAFIVFTFGAILLLGGLKNKKVGDVLSGAAAGESGEPKSYAQDAAAQQEFASLFGDVGAQAGSLIAGDDALAAGAAIPIGGAWGGSKAVVDIAIDIGKSNGLHVISTKRATKGTKSGGISDHWVGSKNSYAADQSNGSNPTPEMDATARDIAARFGIPWDGSGLVNHTYQGFRLQLIYRTNEGGNHFNHVHFGAKRL